MASLKELRSKIASVKSTQRITSAMKMVAAAKLRRASERAEKSRPYADHMKAMLQNLLANSAGGGNELLYGRGSDDVKILIVIASDRGLCGGFNGQMMREVNKQIRAREQQNKKTKLILVGRKAYNLLERKFKSYVLHRYDELNKPQPEFDNAQKIIADVIERFHKNECDSVDLYYTKFVSAISQIVTPMSLVPFEEKTHDNATEDQEPLMASMDYEPSRDDILNKVIPQNLNVQLYRGMLESFASEQGARMNAMDNATRNAKDMINRLSITYNRSRQAQITKELIEIISGAEAL